MSLKWGRICLVPWAHACKDNLHACAHCEIINMSAFCYLSNFVFCASHFQDMELQNWHIPSAFPLSDVKIFLLRYFKIKERVSKSLAIKQFWNICFNAYINQLHTIIKCNRNMQLINVVSSSWRKNGDYLMRMPAVC